MNKSGIIKKKNKRIISKSNTLREKSLNKAKSLFTELKN